jgi:hypothetical protein
MKRAIGFSFIFLMALSLIQILSPRLEAQNRNWSEANQPRDGVCFYTDSDFRGENFCVNNNESSRNVGPRYNDRISSIRIFGRAQVTVFDNESFNGPRQTFNRDMPNLGSWNDRITSFESSGERPNEGRNEGPSRGQFPDRGRGNEPRNGVCFYRDTDYRGERFCVSSDESLGNIGERYNDRISSIRIFGRASITVYENEGFNGPRRTISRDMPNLGNWSDRITSFRVTGGRPNEGPFGREPERPNDVRRNGGEPRDGACFYRDAGFRGDRFCMNAGERLRNVEDRFNDAISSIQIFGRGRAVVHEHENFGGARRTITGDVSNLGGDFNDRISSIEVR